MKAKSIKPPLSPVKRYPVPDYIQSKIERLEYEVLVMELELMEIRKRILVVKAEFSKTLELIK